MCCLSSNDRTIVSPRIETEIPRDHKEEGNREATDCLHGDSNHSRVFTMHENHTKTSYPFNEIQANIIYSHR